MSKHTPGPWNTGKTTKNWFKIFSEAGQELAEIKAVSSPGSRLAGDFDIETANVRLMKTSPDLYALAQAVVTWAKTPGNHGGNPYLHDFVKMAERILEDLDR